MSVVIRTALVFVLGLSASATLSAQDHPPIAKPAAAGKSEKQDAPKHQEMFVIVKVGEHRQVMAKSAVDTLKKQKAEQFEKAHSAWETEKKAAEGGGKKFDKHEPVAETVQALDGEFPSQAAADEALAKMIAEEKKAEEAKKKTAGEGHRREGGGHTEQPQGAGHKRGR